MKNLEKVEKILNILEFSKKFHHFSTFFSVCFHMNWLKIKYLSTEKTSKNPRNSAYLFINPLRTTTSLSFLTRTVTSHSPVSLSSHPPLKSSNTTQVYLSASIVDFNLPVVFILMHHKVICKK